MRFVYLYYSTFSESRQATHLESFVTKLRSQTNESLLHLVTTDNKMVSVGVVVKLLCLNLSCRTTPSTTDKQGGFMSSFPLNKLYILMSCGGWDLFS